MKTPASLPFEKCILAICGIQNPSMPSCLLSSLPSELAFNSLRDCSRRHSKQEKATACAIHAVAWKSSCQHSFGCSTLDLVPNDWSTPIKKGQIRKMVFENHRATDKELGISAEGLTKHKVNKAYTKPHCFTNRLHLLNVLSRAFKEISVVNPDPEEQFHQIVELYDNMWVSKICPELWFVRCSRDDMEEIPEQHCLLVSRAGPFTLGCVKMVRVEGCLGFKIADSPVTYLVVDSLEKV